MLELFFLNFADSVFFEKPDWKPPAMEQMAQSENLNELYVAGPKLFKIDVHKNVPLFVAIKENNRDNIEYKHQKQGTLIFSSNTSGDVKLQKLVQLDKMPLPGAGAKTQKEKTQGGNLKVNYEGLWKDIPAQIFPEFGDWNIALHNGNNISNVHKFKLVSQYHLITQSQFLKKLKSSDDGLSEEALLGFKKNEQSPDIPELGFSFKCVTTNKEENNSPLVVYGSFSLDYDISDNIKNFPINIFVSAPEFDEPKVIQIFAPLTSLKIQEGKISGYFQFDLMKLFFAPGLDKYFMQPEVYVSGVYKDYFSKPILIKLE